MSYAVTCIHVHGAIGKTLYQLYVVHEVVILIIIIMENMYLYGRRPNYQIIPQISPIMVIIH